MAFFLTGKDYNALIRVGNLDQIAQDTATRQTCELIAQSELTSYLSNRFNTTKIFAPLLEWDALRAYTYNERLNFDATAFNAVTVYVNGNLLSYLGNVYQKNSETSGYVAGTLPTDDTFFDIRGAQAIYYVTPPAAWSYSTTYILDDKVSWKGSIYKKNANTGGYVYGVYPDDTTYFDLITDYAPYALTAGTWPNESGWTLGDNRNPQIVMYTVDIALYHVHANLNPRNIPQLRIDRYNNAINWCKMVNAGDITADLPQIAPVLSESFPIKFGSNDKLPQYW